jgi:transcriptional regulator of arginine metabolism
MKKPPNNDISFALRTLIQEGSVSTHEEICQALQKQGYPVNQPKISRLLHQIGAIKVVNQQGQTSYRLPHEQGLMHELNTPNSKLPTKSLIFDITDNGNLIVIHTTPGAASLVAREIDLHHRELGILGSIAGDDTIFIAPKDIKKIKEVLEGIKNII